MANKKNYKPDDIRYPNQKIIESDLVSEMKESYIDYSMSVIVGRALPDVRDGLKPVHRRILYAMQEDGLTNDKQFKKSATCVGDVLGRYHPHGDASVYDALVRLAQDFSMRYPLVDGHGNFGSIDGDPPAAYRYTEARMSKISDYLLKDIDKDTVDWDPNFDESRKEPHVLPARFPNLLVNGSSGIAVGMATNIPPHNMNEVIDATICILDNKDATLDDLMQHIKGPDFPTRGIIMGLSGIREAYQTGRGRFIVRARTEFEKFGNNRTRIVVTELPYQVNKRALITNMLEQARDKVLDGISDIRDETDRNGIRIVIELTKSANPNVVLNNLFKKTALQTSFSINMLALVNNQTQPKILSLRHVLDEYIIFQREVITRRTVFEKKKAEDRIHLLNGLLIAQDNITKVINIIRKSYDNAKEELMAAFKLDEVQAQAICDMRLIALQGLNKEKLQAEHDNLVDLVKHYTELLNDPAKLDAELRKELLEIKDKFGDERKTEIQCDIEDIKIDNLIKEEDCVFTLTAGGYIKRVPVRTYSSQKRGGKGKTAQALKEDDYVTTMFTASTHDNMLFFTNFGKAYKKRGFEIPESSRTAKGTHINNVFNFAPGEQVATVIYGKNYNENGYLFMVTKLGTVKKVNISEFQNVRSNGKRCISFKENDELIRVIETDGKNCIALFTHEGRSLVINESEVRASGTAAIGVIGIRLKNDDYVVDATKVIPNDSVLIITENGYSKQTEIENYLRKGDTVQRRGSVGLLSYKITKKTGKIVSVRVVHDDDDIIAVTNIGKLIRIDAATIKKAKRVTQGTRVFKTDEEQTVVALAVVKREEEEPV